MFVFFQPKTSLILWDYHIHHFFYGIALLYIAGWIVLNYRGERLSRISCVLYGSGLGVLFDEIGLLLTWGEYWSNLTYTFVVGMILLFLNLLFFAEFWVSVQKDLVKYVEGFHNPFIIGLYQNIVEEVSRKMTKTEKISLMFSGTVLVVCGILVLLYPEHVYYWIAAGFFLSALSQFVRAVKS